MNIYISSFAAIRKFPKNLIPVATTFSVPAFYDGGRENNVFVSKSGVVFGYRCPMLNPHLESVECTDCDHNHPQTCSFIPQYAAALRKLDFNKIIEYLVAVKKVVESTLNYKDCDICLIVYEALNNPCSERKPLIDYFAENGWIVKNFEEL